MVLLGGTLYGTMSSIVKLAYAHGFTAAQLSFWQAALAAFFLSIITLCSRKPHARLLLLKDLLSLLLTGSAIGLTNFLYYLSVSYIDASIAIIILMQFTWFSLLLEWLLFKHRPSQLEFLTTLLILLGTVLASNLSIGSMHYSLLGCCLALCSALTYSAYIIANGRVGKSVGWKAKSAIIMSGSCFTIFGINAGGSILASSYLNYDFCIWALFLSLFGTTIPTALFAAGISKIGEITSSILMTIELPVAILCASLIIGEHISVSQTCGIVLMFSSICVMNYFKNKG